MGPSPDTLSVVQAALIARIFAGGIRDGVCLKGGHAMRLLHPGTERRTNDIDLSAPPDAGLGSLDRRVRRAVAELAASGLIGNVQVTAAKTTGTTQRWKVTGSARGHQITFKVEVSRRELIDARLRRTVPVEHAGETIPVAVYAAPLMAASKVACLVSENREASRDLWDLWVLVEAGIRPAPEILRRIGGPAEAEAAIARVWSKLEVMDWQRAQAELLDVLPPQLVRSLDADRWDGIRLAVGQRVETWLHEATQENDRSDMPDGSQGTGRAPEPLGGSEIRGSETQGLSP